MPLILNSKVFSNNEAQKQPNGGERKRRDGWGYPPLSCVNLTPTHNSSTGTRELILKANEKCPQQTEVEVSGKVQITGPKTALDLLSELTHFWFHLRHLNVRYERPDKIPDSTKGQFTVAIATSEGKWRLAKKS